MAADDLKWLSQDEMQKIAAENKQLDKSVQLMMTEVDIRIKAQIKAEKELKEAKKELKLIKQMSAERINNLQIGMKKLKEENQNKDITINELQQEIMKYKELLVKIKLSIEQEINSNDRNLKK